VMHALRAMSEGESDTGSHTRSYYFGPSTVTVTQNHEMLDQGYFTESGAHAPGEETILELGSDEVVIF
jgi:hypothetical protein